MQLKNIGSNQTQIEIGGNVIFFSYNTPVAAQLKDGGLVRTSRKWSATTSKHINAWLNGATAKEVEQSVLDTLAN